MKYYKVMYDYENDKNAICCKSDNLFGISRYDLEKGKLLDAWDERIVFNYNVKEGHIPTDYLGNNLGWLIVSATFKNMLESTGIQGVQYFPIRIVNESTGIELHDYFVANVHTLVDALDLKHSKYDEFELDDGEKVMSIEFHALKKETIKGNHIFRLKGDNIPLFVSEVVKDSVKRHGITGFDFLEVKTV